MRDLNKEEIQTISAAKGGVPGLLLFLGHVIFEIVCHPGKLDKDDNE